MFDIVELLDNYEIATLIPMAGVVLGVLFGAVAQRSRFCLRSAVIGSGAGSIAPMAGAFATALLVAILGAQALQYAELVDLTETRFFGDSLPLGALVIGGALFGAGMVLTRGCASRLTVLTAQGNLRALMVLIVFGIIAYASIRGLLAVPRIAFTDATMVEVASAALPLPAVLLLMAGLAGLIWRSRPGGGLLAAGFAIGALVTLGWYATGVVLYDEFDPKAAESLAFTSASGDSLFYLMAGTAFTPSFGAGLIGGALIGSFLAAGFARELRLESFETPQQTLRYLAGAVMMGVGGVMAGGCTIGAGLTGLSTLALGPLVALVAIILGGMATHRLVDAAPSLSASVVAAE